MALGLEPAYRRAQLWRDLKARIQDLVDNKQWDTAVQQFIGIPGFLPDPRKSLG